MPAQELISPNTRPLPPSWSPVYAPVYIFVHSVSHIYKIYFCSLSCSQLGHWLYSPGTVAGRTRPFAAGSGREKTVGEGLGRAEIPALRHGAPPARRRARPPPAGLSAVQRYLCGSSSLRHPRARSAAPGSGARRSPGSSKARGAAGSRGRQPGPPRRSVSFPWCLMRALI